MHQRIVTTVRQLRQDLAHHLDDKAIHEACRNADHRWRRVYFDSRRDRSLVHHSGAARQSALKHISLLSGRAFTGSAYCIVRSNLPLRVYKAVLQTLIKALVPDSHTDGLWLGRHRTLLSDGSAFSMPDTQPSYKLLRSAWKPAARLRVSGGQYLGGVSRGHRAFAGNSSRSVADSRNGLYRNPSLDPRTRGCSGGRPGLLLIRAFGFVARAWAHAVIRMHQRQLVDFTPNRPYADPKGKSARKGLPRSRWMRKLGVTDQLVEWFKPRQKPRWMSQEKFAALPETLILRELSYRVGRPGFRTETVTLITTLLDAEIYTVRWRVEQNLKHLKQTMKMDVLKCMTVEGVLKELTIFAIVHNLVRVVMMEAAARQGVDVERIGFIDALRRLCEMKTADLPELVVNPARPGRFEPRVRKRRPKEYPLMKKPRSELRKRLIEQRDAA